MSTEAILLVGAALFVALVVLVVIAVQDKRW